MNDMKYLYEVACHYKAGNWFRDLDDEITKKVMEKANGVLEKKIAISGSKEADWITVGAGGTASQLLGLALNRWKNVF